MKVLNQFGILLSLALVAIASAHADHGNHRGGGNRHNGQGYQQPRHGYQGGIRYQYGYQQRYNYNYAQPVYAPPPVYYQPMQSPGINLFFPLDIRVR